ncbi:unnamed protein product, partial [Rotaria socialis]
TTPLATLEVRSQPPPSPKSQQQQPQTATRPSATPTNQRTPSLTHAQVDCLIQSQAKHSQSSNPSSSLPVAVVRSVQSPSTSITPTSPLNLPSLNVTLPQNKLTTNTTTATATTTTTTTMTSNNPAQQLRTAAAFLSNQTQTSSSVQQTTQQIRQIFTNANNNSLQTQQTANTQ